MLANNVWEEGGSNTFQTANRLLKLT